MQYLMAIEWPVNQSNSGWETKRTLGRQFFSDWRIQEKSETYLTLMLLVRQLVKLLLT